MPINPSLADNRHAGQLAKSLARYDLLLAASIGTVWGTLIFHFLRHVADWSRPLPLILVAPFTLILGWAGARIPDSWYRPRDWERAGGGRTFERFGVRTFKRFMSHGDIMNAALRRRVPSYRAFRPGRLSAEEYARNTVPIERSHLAWGLGAFAPTGYAMLVGAWGFATLLTLANLLTNGWPILLQRYNRVRAEGVVARMARR